MVKNAGKTSDICFPSALKMQFGMHRGGAVKMFYLTPTGDRFSGKFVKWVRFLAVLQEHIFYVKWGEICKMKFLSKTVL